MLLSFKKNIIILCIVDKKLQKCRTSNNGGGIFGGGIILLLHVLVRLSSEKNYFKSCRMFFFVLEHVGAEVVVGVEDQQEEQT